MPPESQPNSDAQRIVTEGLNLTRKNLLDLSGRNKLLNFKHTGSKVLRFADELPNFIYSELISAAESDKGFIIAPVPLPKRADYPDTAPKDLKKIDVKAHARFLGINTEFEMVAAASSKEAHHHDDKLQTLHYPEDLDRMVRRIQSEARTAIEESGVNMLFLCLGYLKWSDRDDSNVFNYAPLIMVPVEIERDKIDVRTGFAKFRLKYTGEDILDNICLREKLRQLAIELPSFEDFDTPEEYFSALTEQLEDVKPQWAIHRFVTMGFLSFGKMLMYLDLDPARWPGEEGIAEANHIFDIFAGNHSGGEPVASEFDIDGDKKIQNVPQVMDADSSQHSAILDVLAGRNVVIEGPPGTGKSQTITNLIAACIAEGKTVLFVAEKLAALQVVRKRLDSVGLGDFCLELHSHKTQKKVMLADLNKRLEMKTGAFRTAGENAEVRLRELNLKRNKLIEYSKVINTPYGATGLTPHEIFWKTEVLKKQCSEQYKPEHYVVPQEAEKLTQPALREHMDAIQNLADSLRMYFDGDSRRNNHYWQGFNLSGHIDYAKQQDIIGLLRNVQESAIKAKAAFANLQGMGIDGEALKTYKLERMEQDDFAHAQLYSALNLPTLHSELDSCSKAISTYQEHLSSFLAALDSSNTTHAQISGLDSKIVKSAELPVEMPFSEMKSISERITPPLESFKKAQPIFREAAAYLGVSEETDKLAALQAIKQAAVTCSEIDSEMLAHRKAALEQSMDNSLISSLPDKLEELRLKQKELKEALNFDALPPQHRLIEIAAALRGKSLLSPLSKEWRNARNEFKAFAINDLAKDGKASANKLDRLVEYQKELEAVENSAAYNTLLPGIFKGLETDTDSLKNGLKLYTKLRSEIRSLANYGATLYGSLLELAPETYEWFAKNRQILTDGIQGISASSAMQVAFTPESSDTGIKATANRIEKFNSELEKLQATLTSQKIPEELTLTRLRKMLIDLEALNKAEECLSSDLTIKALGFTSQPESLEEQLAILQSLKKTAAKLGKILPEAAMPHVLNAEGFITLQSIIDLLEQISTYQENLKKLTASLSVAKYLSEFWNYGGTENALLLDAIIAKLAVLEDEISSFATWCDVVNHYAELKKLGLDAIINSFATNEDGIVNFSDYVALYHYLVYNALSHEVLKTHRVLGSFARVTHENLRASFKEIDLELQKLNAQSLAREISRKPIPEGFGGRSPKEFTDARLIRHEIGKQKAHIPIRQMVNRAYDCLIAMKPCFMMGPLSVAQYIPPDRTKFDIVIMDEASQLKPEDAIGVLARAKQVVVVGDSNQLPPTGFFDTLGGDHNEDEETTIANSESILDVCKPLFQPLRRLRWHYRSQHQSLISFSNSHFYDNDLIIFPSPTAHSPTAGVKHVFVPNGVYTSQSNPIEAQRVVQEVMEMVQARPDLSYGIVTLNAKQKMVIEDEIERVRKDNPVFDTYISDSEKTDENFFVKNLESVQGDERDVIFISTTFGLDEEGTFRQHFGPINGKDGWRRLNVLFTRAKQHVRIFSSFQPERIKIDDTKEQRGLRALKDYLNYAITGIDNHSYLTGQEPDSDFERAVGGFLQSKGYDVVYQLGVAGYRIDMVVRHPQCPTDYVIAVECDGATYHSARTARDRDRLREDNLRKLGWSHIHRIWSTDWFRRREQEEQRLLQAVEAAINAKVAVAA